MQPKKPPPRWDLQNLWGLKLGVSNGWVWAMHKLIEYIKPIWVINYYQKPIPLNYYRWWWTENLTPIRPWDKHLDDSQHLENSIEIYSQEPVKLNHMLLFQGMSKILVHRYNFLFNT